MEYRFVLFETGSQPEIYKVPLNRTARLVNEYPNRKVEMFENLQEATAAALALVERAETRSRARIAMFSDRPSPEAEALRRKFSELTEDRIETFVP